MIHTKIIVNLEDLSEDLKVRLADELTNARSLTTLALHGGPLVQIHALQNPEMPTPMFEVLYDKGSWEVRKELAENVRTPRNILLRLRRDRNISVRLSAMRALKK